jgi:hypothetical protein
VQNVEYSSAYAFILVRMWFDSSAIGIAFQSGKDYLTGHRKCNHNTRDH